MICDGMRWVRVVYRDECGKELKVSEVCLCVSVVIIHIPVVWESKREIEYKNTTQKCYLKETKSLGGMSVCGVLIKTSQ